MANEIDYLPVGTATGANVDSQANFAGSPYQEQGFQTGVAFPYQANKIWRQSSMMAAAIANIISTNLNIPVLDDGNLPALINNLSNAINALISNINGVAMTQSSINSTPIGSTAPSTGIFSMLESTSYVQSRGIVNPAAVPLNSSFMVWNQEQGGFGQTSFINGSGTGTGGFNFYVVTGSGGTGALGTACMTISSTGLIGLPNVPTAASANAGSAAALPAAPAGYMYVSIAGTQRKIPYYGV